MLGEVSIFKSRTFFMLRRPCVVWMHRSKGKVMVRINDHLDIPRVFAGFHFETLDIRYSRVAANW
jgi:hypothetical protein